MSIGTSHDNIASMGKTPTRLSNLEELRGLIKFYKITEEWEDSEDGIGKVKCLSPRFVYDKDSDFLQDFIRENPEEVIKNNVLFLCEFLADELGADLVQWKPNKDLSAVHVYDYAIRHNGEQYVLSDMRNFSRPVEGVFNDPMQVLDFLLNTEVDRLSSDPYYASQGEKIITTSVYNITPLGWQYLDEAENRTKARYELLNNPDDYPEYVTRSYQYDSVTSTGISEETKISKKGAEALAEVLEEYLDEFRDAKITAKELKELLQDTCDDYRNKYKIGRVFSDKLLAACDKSLNSAYIESAIMDVCSEYEVKIKVPKLLPIDFPETQDIYNVKRAKGGKITFSYRIGKDNVTRHWFEHQILWRAVLNVMPSYYVELMHYAESREKFVPYDLCIDPTRLRTLGEYHSKVIMKDPYKKFRKEVLDDLPAYSDRAQQVIKACENALYQLGVVNPMTLVFARDVLPKARVNDLVYWYAPKTILTQKDFKVTERYIPQYLHRGLISTLSPLTINIVDDKTMKPTGNIFYPNTELFI